MEKIKLNDFLEHVENLRIEAPKGVISIANHDAN
jgi:hypothetical protein